VFPGAVHRRDGVAAAERRTPDGHHEHEVGPGAQVPRSVGTEVGKLRGVHALRPLPRSPVARREPTQPESGEFVVCPVLKLADRQLKVRPLAAAVFFFSPIGFSYIVCIIITAKTRRKRVGGYPTIIIIITIIIITRTDPIRSLHHVGTYISL